MRRAALAAITIVIAFTAPACRGSAASDNQSQAEVFVPVDPASTSPTDQAIAKAQTRLKVSDEDDYARLDLAAAFLQKARETADPSYYLKARGLLDRAKKTLEDTDTFWTTEGVLQLAEHDFKGALESGNKAVKLNASSAAAYGVVVDANNELGNSEEALNATQKMLDLRPDLAALSRASYARELRGDIDGAIQAMVQAVDAGGSGGENVAYVQVLLGNLLLLNGDLEGASKTFDAALVSFPGFVAARAGQAQLLLAEGKPNEAAALLDEVLKTQPLEAYAVARGDALVAAGDEDEAQKAYALVEAINKLFAANGVNVDREGALFAADHRPGKDAVDLARRALKDRGSLAGHDVLAWALFTDGNVKDAAKESDKALADGSKDPLQRYHAAKIALAQGNRDKARQNLQIVIDTNPRFSGAFIADIEKMAQDLGLKAGA